jgi:hypothetical protein
MNKLITVAIAISVIAISCYTWFPGDAEYNHQPVELVDQHNHEQMLHLAAPALFPDPDVEEGQEEAVEELVIEPQPAAEPVDAIYTEQTVELRRIEPLAYDPSEKCYSGNITGIAMRFDLDSFYSTVDCIIRTERMDDNTSDQLSVSLHNLAWSGAFIPDFQIKFACLVSLGADIHYKKRGTPLLVSAMQDQEVFDFVLSYFPNARVEDLIGRSGQLPYIRVYESKGGDLNVEKSKEMLLHVLLLFPRLADIGGQNETFISGNLWNHSVDVWQRFNVTADVENFINSNEDGQTLLHDVAFHKKSDVFYWLVSVGGDPYRVDNFGNTPMGLLNGAPRKYQ